jgi:hypothetical protein
VTPDQSDPAPGRRRRRGPWIAALLLLLALIVAAGVVTAVVTGDDDGDDLTEQVRSAADEGIDAATDAGDDALDTVTGEAPGAADAGVDAVTSAGDEALDTATEQADEAVDAVTGGSDDSSGPAPQAVQDDPVVQQLAKGRELPFVAGPWARRQYRDRVFDRLSEATRERAEKVEQGDGFGIRIQ